MGQRHPSMSASSQQSSAAPDRRLTVIERTLFVTLPHSVELFAETLSGTETPCYPHPAGHRWGLCSEPRGLHLYAGRVALLVNW